MSADNQQERRELKYSAADVAEAMKVYGELMAAAVHYHSDNSNVLSRISALSRMKDKILPKYKTIIPEEVRKILESRDPTIGKLEEELKLKEILESSETER
jgi:hypothetical protein